jgi:hypothetical protein
MHSAHEVDLHMPSWASAQVTVAQGRFGVLNTAVSKFSRSKTRSPLSRDTAAPIRASSATAVRGRGRSGSCFGIFPSCIALHGVGVLLDSWRAASHRLIRCRTGCIVAICTYKIHT